LAEPSAPSALPLRAKESASRAISPTSFNPRRARSAAMAATVALVSDGSPEPRMERVSSLTKKAVVKR